MAAKVVQLVRGQLQTPTEVLNQIRIECYWYDTKHLAKLCGVRVGTIYSFRSGRTEWPRPTTLFPLLVALGYRIEMKKC